MVKRTFKCINCGRSFEIEVFEPGEAEEKGRLTSPVKCPECKSTNIERR